MVAARRLSEFVQQKVLLAVMVLYASSLPWSVCYFENRHETYPGYMCLFLTPIALLGGYWEAGANVVLVLWSAAVNQAKCAEDDESRLTWQITGVLLSGLAVYLALVFLGRETLLIDEAGNEGTITRVGPGFYFWVSSMTAAFAGSVLWIVVGRFGFGAAEGQR
ncbi:MAG: hypothetical protein AAGA92_09960 [Planctomycetota bacterium]